MDPYVAVLRDAAWNASIIPFSNEATLFAMRGFGGFDLHLALLLAIAGAMAGLLFNWGVGRLILLQFRKGKFKLNVVKYEKAAAIFRRYLLFLLLLCWNPTLNYIPVISAFLGVRLRLALPLMLAGEAGYYIYQLFY